MSDFFGGGLTYQVNPAGSDITDFDPSTDRLDFGEMSVHGLIIGSLPDGTASIVNPWADQVQSLQGLSWNDLSLDNLGVVGNEHLRQDIGAVLSWEQNIGARVPGTVYLRSHQFGVQEVINGFDPQSQKLSFLYVGTRERLSVVDTDQGLLIQFEPTNQSVLLKGVQRSDLIGANLEFHHDQVMEDNLEVPFGFTEEDVSLVSRAGLLTPQAPSGAFTDGEQVRAGLIVNPDSTVIAMESTHSMHDHSKHQHSMPRDGMSSGGMALTEDALVFPRSAELQASVAGQLYSGGMGGTLSISNSSNVALQDWSFSFLTNQPQFESWTAESSVKDLGGGRYQVTLTPPTWGLEIPAGGSVDLSFNAGSIGLPDSGALTNAMFFVETSVVEDLALLQSDAVVNEPPVVEDPQAVEILPVMDAPSLSGDSQGLLVTATITDGWSGIFVGDITVTNLGDVSVGTDWNVSVVMDARLTMVSNFEVQSVLRSDGRYDVNISPKSWAAPLDPGFSETSYYQAAGEAIDPAEIFDFGEAVTSSSVIDQPADSTDIEIAESSPHTSNQTSSPFEMTDSADLPVETLVDNLEVGSVSVGVQTPDVGSHKRIVTYFEEWGVYERDINLSDVNGQSMTHLNYSFFDVKADGSVELFDSYAAREKRFSAGDQVSRTFTTAEYQAVDPVLISAYNSDQYTVTETVDSVTVTSVPVGWNAAGPQDAGNFEQLLRFKELNPSVNLGFALGGWTLSDEFSTAFASQAGRDQFTSDVVDIFKTYDFFSVVDFDWEYPGGGGDSGNVSSSNDGANFALVLEQLRSELDALEVQTAGNYEVSIATAGGSEKLANLNLPGIDPYVDFYNVMTYDFHGGWENQTGHQSAMTGDANNYDVTTAVSVFEEAGVALNKVVLGAPAYTRAWGGVKDGGTFGYQQSGTGVEAEGSFEAGVYDYKDIVTDVITGQTDLYWDDNNKAAFVYNGDEWSSIETTATIAGKAAYVQEKDLGGMMFWALSNDAEGELSLVETADAILRQGASYHEAIEMAPAFDNILGGNGEFSVRDFTGLA
jgi:chitinase